MVNVNRKSGKHDRKLVAYSKSGGAYRKCLDLHFFLVTLKTVIQLSSSWCVVQEKHLLTCGMGYVFVFIISLYFEYVFGVFLAFFFSTTIYATSGGWFNINMASYQYRKSHFGDKTILRPSYLHNGISYTGKMPPLYWISGRMSKTWLISHREKWDMITCKGVTSTTILLTIF